MPNFSGVWDLREQGVAVKGDRWQKTLPQAANMGLVMGGYSSSTQESRIIEYLDIASGGNATLFGELYAGGPYGGSCSSTTKAFNSGGYTGSARVNVIQTVTYASTGGSSDFGDLTHAPTGSSGCSSTTRGVFAGGDDG
tara:strand:- start:1967 stop:2383 length:417 start_codon:yes stop_codon:yes gene_type:complete